MKAPKKLVGPTSPNSFLSFSAFLHQHTLRLSAKLATLLLPAHSSSSPILLPFASASHSQQPPRHAAAVATSSETLSSDHVAKTLAGTSIYTVSNSNNEVVLISGLDGAKSIDLLCFRREDAETFLAQVRGKNRDHWTTKF
ncbi:unnamed protein product [Coffea canephora]|uniref:DH200=94 genomic scaffold, scaffold_2236 n=1 Tax=Coffea canephora TaxID=49390 RepID=A0A068VJJ8_COFCA|nr:unnamed protein product [Coffea canephora]